jgi:hypothetical protein
VHDISIRQKRMLVREKKQGQIVRRSEERVRLVVAAAAVGAASAAASAAVPSSCELVGSGVPSVTAVAAVETAQILLVARGEGADTAAPRVVGAAAASATGPGTGSRVGGR